jgi:hypothetical protein
MLTMKVNRYKNQLKIDISFSSSSQMTGTLFLSGVRPCFKGPAEPATEVVGLSIWPTSNFPHNQPRCTAPNSQPYFTWASSLHAFQSLASARFYFLATHWLQTRPPSPNPSSNPSPSRSQAWPLIIDAMNTPNPIVSLNPNLIQTPRRVGLTDLASTFQKTTQTPP